MNSIAENHKRSIRSYVLRTGRMTDSQKRAFDRHWQTYGLSSADGQINPADVFGRKAPLVVELGFGMGESLLTMANQQPDLNFIGIEVHTPGVGRLMNQLADNEIANLRVYCEDGLQVLKQAIPDDGVARFQLYFPDPWPKKKHHKRRIVQVEFMQLVWRKLQAGGIFHLATDWQEYAEHMLAVFAEQQTLFANQAGKDRFSPRPDFRPLTKFEQRGQRLGHGVWDLVFEKLEFRKNAPA